MTPLKKNIQKFFVYFFTGTSILLVVLGVTRIKKGEPIAEATAPDQKSNSAQTNRALALRGATQTAFNGTPYQTPWGNLAVAIQVKDGKVAAVSIPTIPDSPPSQQAKAQLIEQTIKSGGANIQGVSGATITSLAFKASLESALAKAATVNTALATNSESTNVSLSQSLPKTTEVNPAPPTKRTPPVQTAQGVSGTFTGNPYQTPWGNAVASMTVSNGKITAVTMPQVPNSPPSQYAEQYLVSQALAAGSANIQGVSGATYVSIAFKSSLESAIAKANATANAQGQGAVSATPSTTSTASTPSVERRYQRYEDNEWDD